MNERIGIAFPSPILPYLSDLYFKIVALPKPDQISRGGRGIGFDFVKRESNNTDHKHVVNICIFFRGPFTFYTVDHKHHLVQYMPTHTCMGLK